MARQLHKEWLSERLSERETGSAHTRPSPDGRV